VTAKIDPETPKTWPRVWVGHSILVDKYGVGMAFLSPPPFPGLAEPYVPLGEVESIVCEVNAKNKKLPPDIIAALKKCARANEKRAYAGGDKYVLSRVEIAAIAELALLLYDKREKSNNE